MTKLKQEWETPGSHHWDKENLDSDSSPCTENSSRQNSRLGLGLQRLRSSQEEALDSSSDGCRTSQGVPSAPEAGKSRNAELSTHRTGWESMLPVEISVSQ